MIAHLLQRTQSGAGHRWTGLVNGFYVRAWVQYEPRTESDEFGYGYEVVVNNVSFVRSDLGGFDTREDAERAMLDTIARTVEKWWLSIADSPQSEMELGRRLAAQALGVSAEGQRP